MRGSSADPCALARVQPSGAALARTVQLGSRGQRERERASEPCGLQHSLSVARSPRPAPRPADRARIPAIRRVAEALARVRAAAEMQREEAESCSRGPLHGAPRYTCEATLASSHSASPQQFGDRARRQADHPGALAARAGTSPNANRHRPSSVAWSIRTRAAFVRIDFEMTGSKPPSPASRDPGRGNSFAVLARRREPQIQPGSTLT